MVTDEPRKGINNEQTVKQLRLLAPQAIIIANHGVWRGEAEASVHVLRVSTDATLGVLPAIYPLNANIESFHEGRVEGRGPLGATEVLY